MIDLTIDRAARGKNAVRCRERRILLPTFAQMRDPDLIPDSVRRELSSIGLWDVDPLNLFRVTWKNEPQAEGSGFGGVNFLELPPELQDLVIDGEQPIGVVEEDRPAIDHSARCFPVGAEGRLEEELLVELDELAVALEVNRDAHPHVAF